ncbi:MAG: Mrp/NBP35 family ATP-binding protein [Rhodothermaceae bacterium]|nr:Mrp/NBP35 family ATP-binding protein [Rhodothermaceae bacterium]MXZ58053.1 Mrp/NBP35 family ATP-binding protein [Rhodothermaceae bacterium]MYB90190.1 Mrp/NBP35 family ATP-binding protein [Rhodothermaceae bacterium]MYD67216.1 Mrp/NBP35 family ATP-binding protein [Rhodothermaceae bacterium]MYG43681.1 Mrp/NBP35 family ATP-binding protein [Rhodothermaceae bacterium]
MKNYNDIATDGGSDVMGQVAEQHDRLGRRLKRIGSMIAVMSGKGGVGKSTVTASLADALTRRGIRTGVLDADLNGPCMARMMGVRDFKPSPKNGSMTAARNEFGIPVMSMGMFLPDERTPLVWDANSQRGAYTWRSMVEMSALRELLSDTDWGDLDILLIDLPPGAERLQNLVDLLPNLAGAIVVTTPSVVAMKVVGRSISMATDITNVEVVGVIENMSVVVCPACGHQDKFFGETSIVKDLAAAHDVPYLGEIPFDHRLADCLDHGQSYLQTYRSKPAATAILSIAERVFSWTKTESS